ncbi:MULTISPECIES: type II secretion system secretin GspD [unclassified Pseudomonas]|uniref:type II secretion system secretin GspD n=1 Tax=unclassified Pseudomonas TaxID=196821 RepID=UPI0011A6A0C0|nr:MULTISPECIES: type II secretion system secretin GspD [unclassified Pseudomonas]TWC10539.1 general secretion pathway protein D [Pseudomonas sp. SJZ075]TWC26694.1 general secretion pathway protein D [Pseudomonas sp. SJZ078]TWC45849.1 general secretion pathway protein D [Pseudomonas sp. SJZ124]TWC81136.1 general secretion pathway protein D [Pseudomonas sp. SJZ101]
MNSFIRGRVSRVLFGLAVVCPLTIHGSLRAEEAHWQLAMNNAELRDVAEEFSTILGKTVVLDPRVSGRITIMSREALDREGVRRLFYSVLDAHNFTVIDEGERILITPVSDAKTRAGNDAKSATPSQFVTQVIALQSSIAADIAGLVRPLVSTNGYLGPSASANALVVTDTAANVRRITRVVRELDSGANRNHTVVQLRNAQVSDIAPVMEASGSKRDGDAIGTLIADPRSNRLVIIGTLAARQRLVELARTLDVPATAPQDNARVIRLRHSNAKQLAEVLDAVGQDNKVTQAVPGAREKPSDTSFMIKADESQNALVLIAEPAQVRTIENIVRQLDQPRAQVLIHAAIVEISGDISEALGIQWGLNTGSATGLINFPGTDIPIVGGLTFEGEKTAPEGALLRLGSDRFSALISALASNTRSNLLSTPSLLTLDNQESEIIVGQNVPFKTGSYATNSSGSENPFTTVERKDVGISLKIKPFINEGSTLRLEVEQEVSDIAPSVSGVDSSDLITNKRALKSTILADDGEIIVIGGLIRDSVRTQESGVPLLRSIPYLGALFRWTRDTQTKSNLMVFLRPTIVRSKEDLADVSRGRYHALRELSKPGARQSNSLLLPREASQLFEPPVDGPTTELRRQKSGDQ